jgi:hypothetical protein
LSTTSVLNLSGRNEFHHICSESGSDGQEKSEEKINFHWMQGVSALAKKNRQWQDANFSDNPNLGFSPAPHDQAESRDE